jgi:IS5 family transposase
MGEEGVVEWLLTASIEAARKGGVVKESSFEKVIVDTTVMEKAVSYPSDNRVAPRIARQVGRYSHAKQYRQMQAALKGKMMDNYAAIGSREPWVMRCMRCRP